MREEYEALALAARWADQAADRTRAGGAGPTDVARDELVRSYVRSYADPSLRGGVVGLAARVLRDGGVSRPTARQEALAIVALAREHVDADMELADEDFYGRAPGAGEFSLCARDFLGSREFDDPDSAYAVLDDDGTLTFVRSADHVEGGRWGSVVDLGGVRREGVVFAVDEASRRPDWPWLDAARGVRKVEFVDDVRPASAQGMFSGLYSLESVAGAGRLDLSRCSDASEMFWGCSSLASIDVSGWDVRSLAGAGWMFADCRSLSSLDVSRWDVRSLAGAYGMFDGCRSLAALDVSRWDVGRLTEAVEMFRGCRSLATLDVSGWDVWSLEDADSMFWGCSSLSSLDVSRWDVRSLADASCMFRDCSSLASLDVSRWDVRRLSDALGMFWGCSSLSSLDVSRWDVRSLAGTSRMFDGCPAGEGVSLALPGRDEAERDER